MTDDGGRDRALHPDELGSLFVERANAGDVEGVVGHYESTAVLALPDGKFAIGTEEIRNVLSFLCLR